MFRETIITLKQLKRKITVHRLKELWVSQTAQYYENRQVDKGNLEK